MDGSMNAVMVAAAILRHRGQYVNDKLRRF
jgi:hypothetical protein